MLKLPQCNILAQDDLFPETEEGGLVVVVGEAPNAIVKLSFPDFDARKFLPIDRLTRASYTRKGDTWTFTGVSDHLRHHVGVSREDAIISFQVTPEPGCEDCRK